ncbi:3-phosphoshikimate 1-carboxyvinyltransferase [Pelagibacterales bacterium SAG-MED47]|nr:3-phosphoshikimate 1-carboxyvinyltransferase [Pelagibacterales bacterium SAG-MED47]
MKKLILINKELSIFKKKSIKVEGDKSLSIRFIILSSLSTGKSLASNILKSEDTMSVMNILKKLGIKIKLNNNNCEVKGKGLFGYKFKKNLVLNAGNSGTTARLLLSTLIDSNYTIKITGDKSLKKRDMNRVIKPLKQFGAKIKSNKGKLPIFITGTKLLKPIQYKENLGSAQSKSAVLIAALKTKGQTKLYCLPSRNHTELMFKNILKVPIKIKKRSNDEIIQVNGLNEFKSFNYRIPGDISSASFFIVLTLLSKNKTLIIKNVNVNPSRTGIIKILNRMGAKIKIFNLKIYKGEKVADIFVRSNQNLKPINLEPKLNSSAIDEFLLIFLVAGTCKGMSSFKKLSELNKKESKRLDWGIKILNQIGIKTKKIKNQGIKIWGKQNLNLNKTYVIKNYLKDHRVFMTATIAGLALGGNWKIYDPNSFKTSFPSFLKILRDLGAKIEIR